VASASATRELEGRQGALLASVLPGDRIKAEPQGQPVRREAARLPGITHDKTAVADLRGIATLVGGNGLAANRQLQTAKPPSR
jgi:hypothetical protein